jgi:tRNA (cytidine/uridine-2'-O-)-methyltransferase
MVHVALFEPEIPPNTGNIIRLCANSGSQLHLVEPLGFDLDDKKLRRAGLDYHEWADVTVHESLTLLLESVVFDNLYAISTRGGHSYVEVSYCQNDLLLFGPETRGLPDYVLKSLAPEHILRIPMYPESRSMNLSNAAAIIVYEAWRQSQFEGAG